MKEKLIEILGLKATATEQDIVAQLEKVVRETAELKSEVGRLEAKIAAKKAISAKVAVKMAAGLTEEQALEVIENQAKADAGSKA